MSFGVAEDWVAAPLRQFVEDARALVAVVLVPSGQALGQHGFTRSVDVAAACALAAAIHASASELGRQLDGKPFAGLHYVGRARQIFLGAVPTRRGGLLVLTVFDEDSSLGLVQVFFDEFKGRLAAAAPEPSADPPALAVDFEKDLNTNLARMFGRAG